MKQLEQFILIASHLYGGSLSEDKAESLTLSGQEILFHLQYLSVYLHM
jgi:hypothetical protein